MGDRHGCLCHLRRTFQAGLQRLKGIDRYIPVDVYLPVARPARRPCCSR